MKKKIKSRRPFVAVFLILTVLVFAAFGTLVLCDRAVAGDACSNGQANEDITLLLLGVDEAAENTDVILLCSISENGVSMLQIPRDTYVSCASGTGKINQFYGKFLGRSKDRRKAAEEVADLFSKLFGVPIDGYVVVNTDTVSEGVDLLGGIPITLTKTLRYRDKKGESRTLSPGERRLDGEAAMAYLRYREGYATGDLGRLQAQIPFFQGLLKVIREPRSLQNYLSIYQKITPNLLTNLAEKDIIKFMVGYLRERELPAVQIMRLAGEPAMDEKGISYYVLRRATAERMLSEHFHGDGFAHPEAFTRKNSDAFMNIFAVPDGAYLSYLLESGGEPKVVRQ